MRCGRLSRLPRLLVNIHIRRSRVCHRGRVTDATGWGRRSAGDTGSRSSETCERVTPGPNQLDEVIFKVAA